MLGFQFQDVAADEFARNEDELRELLVTGAVAPHIGAVYPLAETARALRHVADGRAIGKVLIDRQLAGMRSAATDGVAITPQRNVSVPATPPVSAAAVERLSLEGAGRGAESMRDGSDAVVEFGGPALAPQRHLGQALLERAEHALTHPVVACEQVGGDGDGLRVRPLGPHLERRFEIRRFDAEDLQWPLIRAVGR